MKPQNLNLENFIDSIQCIYVINLKSRLDRWNDFNKAWEGILDFKKVRRFIAVNGLELSGYGEPPWFAHKTENRAKSWGGVAGCLLSHRAVIEDAREKNYDKILVFEDDARPNQFFSIESLQSILTFLDVNKDWGICYLGYSEGGDVGVSLFQHPSVINSTDNNNYKIECWKVVGVLAMHAYIINSKSYDFLLRKFPKDSDVWSWIARYRAIDTWFMHIFSMRSGLATFVIYPQIVYQAEYLSDISNRISGGNENQKTQPIRSISNIFYIISNYTIEEIKLFFWMIIRTIKWIRSKLVGLPGKR